jgi:hypothetical protein
MGGVGSRAIALSVTLALGVIASEASAQPDEDRASARALTKQAVAHEEAGRWAEAIDLLRRAESLIHAPPHLLHIARAEVKLRRLVSARETYLKITREEPAAGAPPAFVEAQESAQKELAELEPRIPGLTVLVDGGQASVNIDGAPMSQVLVGVERPIDPGRHELQAVGEGTASKRIAIDLSEGAHETVHLVLERSSEASEPPSSTSQTTARDEPRRGGSRVSAYAAWGVGAAGLVFGTAMMFVNRGHRDEADTICQDGSCPASRRSEIESLDADADRAATMSWIGLGVGVIGLGVGTVLFIINGRAAPASPQHAAGVSPWMGLGGAGLSGRF